MLQIQLDIGKSLINLGVDLFVEFPGLGIPAA